MLCIPENVNAIFGSVDQISSVASLALLTWPSLQTFSLVFKLFLATMRMLM